MYDYSGDFEVFEKKLRQAGVPKEEFDITDYVGLTYRELMSLTEQTIARFREKNRGKYYNGKFEILNIVCGMGLRKGKVYEVKDGCFFDDNEKLFPRGLPIRDFDDLVEYFSGRDTKKDTRQSYYGYFTTEIKEIING